MPKPPVDTLSTLRTRVIPKSFDFGGLTLSLERAKARDGSKAPEQKAFTPNPRLKFIERMASRQASPNNNLAAIPIADANPRPRRASQSGNELPRQRRPERQGDRPQARVNMRGASTQERQNPVQNRFTKLNETGASTTTRPRQGINLPNVATNTKPRPASEYVRDVASLDKLAAEAGLGAKLRGDAPAGPPQLSRGYKGRLEDRPQAQPNTRFSIPVVRSGSGARPRRAAGPGGRGKPGGAGAAAGGGAGRAPRTKTKAQEHEASRRQAVQARKEAARPQPVPYTYEGIDETSLSPVLERLREVGSTTTYSHFKTLMHDNRDAARLVVGNRSIVQKGKVLDKIGVWIPPTPAVPAGQRANA